ncbi:7-deoxyloganetic acid glucosyltransferase [Camellia lanceoleosa]|uniref:7-deoxyloganetic acid glucosyltransferase n=1 Tax=Camellia lanceoleosa TaxID=1840588 RepID=A0ACC0IIC4_9ERIC|nr:7-deoxyloganetic acid glucosyltransferase [Camellia lanceoleosa]
MDRSLSGVSGMESFLRIRDLPSWPYFADQQDLIEVRKDEFVRSTDRMAKMARKSVREGGFSYHNLDRMIDDRKSMIDRFSLK